MCLTLLIYNNKVMDKSMSSALQEVGGEESFSFLQFVRVISSAEEMLDRVKKCLGTQEKSIILQNWWALYSIPRALDF